MAYRTILLIGPPGSGKGTQGRILGSIPGYFHCACGDIFRSLDLQSEISRAFWSYSSKGALVPDEFTIGLWQQSIRGMEFTNRFRPSNDLLVLDGLPRNVHQAKMLADTLDVVKIIHLDCDDLDKMSERLTRRALKDNRPDDASVEVIKRRLAVYQRETYPVLKFYPADRIVKVNATRSQVAVLIDLLQAVQSISKPVGPAEVHELSPMCAI